MNCTSSHLLNLLTRLELGEYSVASEAYEVFARTRFFIPVADGRSVKPIANKDDYLLFFPHLESEASFVFTTGLRLFGWAGAFQEHIHVFGDELARIYPEDTYLILNKDQSDELSISPSVVSLLFEFEKRKLEESNINSVKPTLDLSKADLAEQKKEHLITTELKAALSTYQNIEEAYFLRNEEKASTAVLGIHAENIKNEDRFNLMAEVAEISKMHYGIAGAIDVLDDLHIPNSPSWEFFKVLVPFYEKGQDLSHKPQRLTVAKSKKPAMPFTSKDMPAFDLSSDKKVANRLH